MALATIVSGPPSQGADLLLTARVGNNGLGEPAEVLLVVNREQPLVGGATWDPIHTTGLARFQSYFQVRLVVDADPGNCFGAAGTTPYLQAEAEPFTAIEYVQLSASVRKTTSQREASWESAYVQFRYEGGYSEELLLDALPRAVTPQKFRQAATDTPQPTALPVIEQYAELSASGLIGFTVVGVVRFTANEPPAPPELVGADDLQVAVAVFTNASESSPESAPSSSFAGRTRPHPHKRRRP
jgi:hypothetical protein